MKGPKGRVTEGLRNGWKEGMTGMGTQGCVLGMIGRSANASNRGMERERGGETRADDVREVLLGHSVSIERGQMQVTEGSQGFGFNQAMREILWTG